MWFSFHLLDNLLQAWILNFAIIGQTLAESVLV